MLLLLLLVLSYLNQPIYAGHHRHHHQYTILYIKEPRVETLFIWAIHHLNFIFFPFFIFILHFFLYGTSNLYLSSQFFFSICIFFLYWILQPLFFFHPQHSFLFDPFAFHQLWFGFVKLTLKKSRNNVWNHAKWKKYLKNDENAI